MQEFQTHYFWQVMWFKILGTTRIFSNEKKKRIIIEEFCETHWKLSHPLKKLEETSCNIANKKTCVLFAALVDLNGRFFGGRTVRGAFYNLDKFRRLDLMSDLNN